MVVHPSQRQQVCSTYFLNIFCIFFALQHQIDLYDKMTLIIFGQIKHMQQDEASSLEIDYQF